MKAREISYYESFEKDERLTDNVAPMTVEDIIKEEAKSIQELAMAVEKKETHACVLACLSYVVVLWYLYLVFVEVAS